MKIIWFVGGWRAWGSSDQWTCHWAGSNRLFTNISKTLHETEKEIGRGGGIHTYPLRPHKSGKDLEWQKMTILRPIPISSSCVFLSGKRFAHSLGFRHINLEQGISFFP